MIALCYRAAKFSFSFSHTKKEKMTEIQFKADPGEKNFWCRERIDTEGKPGS